MRNNEHYSFVQIGKTLKPNSFAALLFPSKLPRFSVLCFCTTLWGPWLLPMYAHSVLWCIVGRRSHPYQQWCQCFLLISLGNTQPSPPWPTQQPNLFFFPPLLLLSLPLFHCLFSECNRASAGTTSPLAALAVHEEKQPWSWQLCVQTQCAPLVCCLISFSLCLSLSLVHWGLKQLSLFFPVSEGYSGWQDTISGFKIGLPFFTAQEVNSSEMAQSCSSFSRRDWAHLKAFIIILIWSWSVLFCVFVQRR